MKPEEPARETNSVTSWVSWRWRSAVEPLDVFGRVLGDEGAGALLGIEDAADLHLAVGAGDGVGVDGEIDGYATDGGELVSGAEGLGGDGGEDLVDELAIDGDAGVGVEAEGELSGGLRHEEQCTS